jgi:hypothetical protein
MGRLRDRDGLAPEMLGASTAVPQVKIIGMQEYLFYRRKPREKKRQTIIMVEVAVRDQNVFKKKIILFNKLCNRARFKGGIDQERLAGFIIMDQVRIIPNWPQGKGI